MKIENTIKNEIPLSEIKVAEIFLFSNEYWIKTAHYAEHNGNMLWYCVNMGEGTKAQFSYLMKVIPVNARLIIE